MRSQIDIQNIYFSFPNNPLFTDFSYSFNENEITTIIGNSGCGKSTLLNLISGLLKPASGEISVNSSFAFLTQNPTLLPYYNAYENSLLSCELRNIKSEQKEKETDNLFDLFKLPDNSKDKFPKELSGGMQQRIGLIQTLLVDAQIYLLDEPYKGIDRVTSLVIQNYIWNKLKTNNALGIIVTHDIEQTLLVGDKVLFLSTNKPAEEFSFDKDFILLPPEKRLKTEIYSEYMYHIIRKLGEL